MTTTAENKRITPKLRFPEFGDDWKETPLGGMGTTISGLTYSPSDIRKEGLLVLRSSNVQSNKIVYEDSVYVRADIRGANRVVPGDILICVRNGSTSLIGKNAVIPSDIGDVAFGAFMTVFRPNANGFAAQLLRTDRYKRQVAADLGARINSINSSQLKKYRFVTPSLPEQQKIAAFLGAVDDKIAQLQEKKALLEDYKKGCMQKLFSRELRFKNDDGMDFPDWLDKRLGEIIEAFSGGTPAVGVSDYYGGDIPFLKSGEIGSSQTEQTITGTGLKSSSAKLVQRGDLLIALYGATAGESAIVQIDGAINQAVLCVRTDQDKNYLLNWFHFSKDWIRATFLQGGQGNLSADIIKSLPIKIPHPDEQRKIADFLSAIDTKIQLISSELEQAQNFKKGLLQQMFV